MRHRKFVSAFIANNFNGFAAYREVYPKAKESTARRRATTLLRRADIRREIADQTEQALEALGIRRDAVLGSLALIAFHDPRDVCYDDYEPKPLNEIPADIRRVMQGVSIINNKTGRTVNLNLCDRMKAIELLGRHLGLIGPEQQIQAQAKVNLVIEDDVGDTIKKARERAQKEMRQEKATTTVRVHTGVGVPDDQITGRNGDRDEALEKCPVGRACKDELSLFGEEEDECCRELN